ncbi:hypothetical protein D9757_005295 [Collybiopsis confluens]|uniref:Uncharacterized protein n=1 Tax=Collybiopsis confluens TaxID=2823264 RepID=A0A8H5HVR5_9AGAR|nr:hypothetical protein D9757_005295 [Collybiopsis confluens]
MSRLSIRSISSSRSFSSQSTILSEEIQDFNKQRDDANERYTRELLLARARSQAQPVTSADTSDYIPNLLPKASGSSGIQARPWFPPRRPIQRSLFVSEEAILPLPDFLVQADPVDSDIPDPISVFHEATNYAYLPSNFKLPKGPVQTTQPCEPNMTPDSPTPYGVQASTFKSVRAAASIIKNTLYVLYETAFAKRLTVLWPTGREKKGKKQSGSQTKEQMALSRTGAPGFDDSEAYQEHNPSPEALFTGYASTESILDSDSEEEEEVEALVKYGVSYPPAQLPSELAAKLYPPYSIRFNHKISCYPSSCGPDTETLRSSASSESPSSRSPSRVSSWDEHSVSHSDEQLISSLRKAVSLGPRLSCSSDHTH